MPGKILCRVILERLRTVEDDELRDNQAGFRRERSCTNHIATLRIIVEQSIEMECNSSLYVDFVDYEKAFDSLDRESLCELKRHYAIPEKFVTLIGNTCKGMTWKATHGGKISAGFEVLTGVRQGCLLSPFLFLLPADWITRKTTANKINGIQWTLSANELDALSYADDLALLSHKLWQLQGKTSDLDSNSAQLGLNIHRRKTKILRLNTTTEHPVTLRGEPLEDVESFR